MPPDSQSFNTNSSPDVMIVDDIENSASSVDMPIDMASVGNNVGHSLPMLSNDDEVQIVQPSTSSSDRASGPRMLRFNVQYCDRIIPIDIPETGTVGKFFVFDFFVIHCGNQMNQIHALQSFNDYSV